MDLRQPPRFLSRWDLAALAGFLALALFYHRILPSLPDPVPTHFDALGHPNGWTAKAQLPLVLFAGPLVMWLVLFVVGAATALLPRNVRAAGSTPIHPLRGLLSLGMCLLMIGCLLMPLRGTTALYAGLLAFFTCMALGIVFLVRDAWQTVTQAPRSEHDRGGVFYMNPQDPRLWVEKRIGVGWTLNFAHPAAVWMCLLMAMGVAAVVFGVMTVVRK